jgi:hypothetical protein
MPEEVRKYMRHHITLEIFCVVYIFFNATDNVDVGVESSVFMLADFGVATCFSLSAILATYGTPV